MRILDYVNRLLLSLSVRQNNHELTNVLVVSNTGLGDTILSTLDIVVLSSDSKEGVPQSIMQALMMNKSVVATDSGSTKDLLESDNFQLVGVGDVNELTHGVGYYLENKIDSEIRRFTVDNFSKTKMVLKILAIYKQILDN